jgi:preprotein translocase subunit SecE
MLERVIRFIREVRMELSKVSWPSRLETLVFTVLVIAMIMVLTVIIFIYDAAFAQIIQYLLGTVR